ncbi:30S ribosome-binding factor RbfA [Alienimonas californiensis]|uniref:Ribosome-binding factor A n=1 Tax=Alienimonas californiensis TaxID=2527989 RepID=A0A517PF18_9PLAN|nr:30S ribosome-binding factor RbfA [Alienimonas californiensis]QDT17963.1 Ribosome-binding factor A [Alienimonas californiensis]
MAKSRKLAKLNRAIREVVSTQVLFNIRDPRVRGVTVLDADIAPDGRTAKVYVTVLGDEEAETRALEGLDSAKGFFQAKIAERLDTRYTPVLTFLADGGVKRSIEISRSLQQATGRSLAEPDPPAPEPFDFKQAANRPTDSGKTSDSGEDPDGAAGKPRDVFALPDPTSPMEPPPPPDRPDGEYTPPSPVARPPRADRPAGGARPASSEPGSPGTDSTGSDSPGSDSTEPGPPAP